MEIALDDLRHDYPFVVNLVAREGREVQVRDLATRELTAVTLVWPDASAAMLPVGVGRGLNQKLAAVEALSLVSGRWRADLVEAASPDYARVLVDPSDTLYGAYGPRTWQQVRDVVAELLVDPTSRRAVVTVWNKSDLTHRGDKPCTLTIQFLLRDDHLDAYVTMRSQDVWLGLAYDAFCFTQLQHTVARALSRVAGRLYLHVGSLHIYERDLERARRLVAADPHVGLPEAAAPGDVRPLGVRAPGSATSIARLQDAARHLLESQASLDVREANPWYDHQVGRIGASA